MTVRDNIGFLLRMQKRGLKPERRRRIEDAAKLLGIGELLDRKPGALSGGQRQRVAMGRAIVRHPTSFLMDEPLSNLDAKLRVQMRAELVKLHQRLGVTTLYVTHDQTEAMTLGERVAVLSRGVIQQVDTPGELYNRPANTFVATFIGSPAMNFLRARLSDGAIAFANYRLELPDRMLAGLDRADRELLLGLRPEHFFDPRLVPSEATRNSIPVTVELTEQLGSETLLYFRADGIEAGAVERGRGGTRRRARRTPRPAHPGLARRAARARHRRRARTSLRPRDGRRTMSLDPASVDRAALGAPLVPRFPIRLRDTEVFTVVYRTRGEVIERLLPAQLEARHARCRPPLPYARRVVRGPAGSRPCTFRSSTERAARAASTRRSCSSKAMAQSRPGARSTASRRSTATSRSAPRATCSWRLWRNGIDVVTATMAYKQQAGRLRQSRPPRRLPHEHQREDDPGGRWAGRVGAEITARTFADVEIHEVWVGQATLELRPNAQAPVYLLPVEEVVEGYYWRADFSLVYGTVLEQVD